VTGARSTVQPTANTQSVDRSASSPRPRRAIRQTPPSVISTAYAWTEGRPCLAYHNHSIQQPNLPEDVPPDLVARPSEDASRVWVPRRPSSSYRGVSQSLRRGPAVNPSAMKLQPRLHAFGRRALHVRRLHEYEVDRGAGSWEGCRPVRVWYRDLRLGHDSKPQAGIPLARAGF
jgi:hypothetical protein